MPKYNFRNIKSIFRQVYHDLLRTEEEFVVDLGVAIENYVRRFDEPNLSVEVQNKKHELTHNLRELYNFHAKFVFNKFILKTNTQNLLIDYY